MDKRRTMPRAAIIGRALESRIGDDRVGAVEFFEMKVGEAGDQARNIAAGSLHFDRHGDGVSVILKQKITGRRRLEAVFSASQNSPSLVVPSPSET